MVPLPVVALVGSVTCGRLLSEPWHTLAASPRVTEARAGRHENAQAAQEAAKQRDFILHLPLTPEDPSSFQGPC